MYWATCSECLTYIWISEPALINEEVATCPYCEAPVPLTGGAQLSQSCNKLQGMLEEIERQIATLPTAFDVHRFISEQVDNISAAFNDRLDEIQAEKDVEAADVETHRTT